MEAAEFEMIKLMFNTLTISIDEVKGFSKKTHDIVSGNGTPEKGLCFRVQVLEDELKDVRLSVGKANTMAFNAKELAKDNAVDNAGELIGATVKIVKKSVWFKKCWTILVSFLKKPIVIGTLVVIVLGWFGIELPAETKKKVIDVIAQVYGVPIP